MNGDSGESQPELTEAQRYKLAARAAQKKFDETGKLPENIRLRPSGTFQVQVKVGGKTKQPTVKTLYDAIRERARLKAEQHAQKHTLPYEKRKALEEEFDKFCDDSIQANGSSNNDDDETAYMEACADGTFCVHVRVLKDEHSDTCEVLGGRHNAQDNARTQLQKLKVVQRYRSEALAARKAFDETKTLPENIRLHYGSFIVRVSVDGNEQRPTFHTLYDALRKRDMLKFEQEALQTNHADKKQRIFDEELEKYNEYRKSGMVAVDRGNLSFYACILKDKGKYPLGGQRQFFKEALADAEKILNGEEVQKHVKATGPNGEQVPRNVSYQSKTQKYITHATVGEEKLKYVGLFSTVEEAVKERDSEEEAAYDLISPVEATRCCKPCKIAFASVSSRKTHEQKEHNGGGVRLCADETCKNKAQSPSKFCIKHGGGHRCVTIGAHNHQEFKPYARYTISANAKSNGHAWPQWTGAKACMDCLRRVDPDNVAVKAVAFKEDVVVAAFQQRVYDLHRADPDDLALDGLVTAISNGSVVHDCPAPGGTSRRRHDVKLDADSGLVIALEVDENQHKFKDDPQCENRKLAGHMIDLNAPFLKREASDIMDKKPEHRTDAELKVLQTAVQEAMRQKRHIQRSLAKARGASSSSSSSSSTAALMLVKKLAVVRFNCDEYVASDGQKIGALMHAVHLQDENAFAKYTPVEKDGRFRKAIERLTAVVVDLWRKATNPHDAEARDRWVDEQRELEIKYVRYDGCDAKTGEDVDGSVYAAMQKWAEQVEKENRKRLNDELESDKRKAEAAAREAAEAKRAAKKQKKLP
jgi:hypothetical protein